jgi:uncharacterized protein involved in exopolysaccharide biosynthesis
MPAAQPDQHSLAPAEQYLRALWDARLLYILVIAAFVGGALVINTVLPKAYSSGTLVSVRQGPRLESAGLLYDTVISGRTQSENEPQGELPTRRFLKRFHANRTVTLAAQDAGVIPPNAGLEERDINRWIDLELIEKTDLIMITVNQPTPDGARLFAQKLLDRALQINREENAAADTRTLLRTEVDRAEADVKAAEQRLIEASRAAGSGVPQKVAQDRAVRELDFAHRAHAALKKRFDAINIILAEQQIQLYVVDPPTTPLRPSFPRPLLNVSVGLILGILAATVIVVLRGVFSRPARRAD